MFRTATLAIFASLTISANSFAATPISSDARVFIISPANGAVVSSPVTVMFGLSGAGVAPAGVDKKNTYS